MFLIKKKANKNVQKECRYCFRQRILPDIRVRKEADILAKNGFNVFVLCYGFKNYDYSKIRSLK